MTDKSASSETELLALIHRWRLRYSGRGGTAFAVCADELESLLRASEKQNQGLRDVPPVLTPDPEATAKDRAVAFVRKIAAYETCDDVGNAEPPCYLDSGPSCGHHYPGQWIIGEIAEARDILRVVDGGRKEMPAK